jgi:hypothetical protein
VPAEKKAKVTDQRSKIKPQIASQGTHQQTALGTDGLNVRSREIIFCHHKLIQIHVIGQAHFTEYVGSEKPHTLIEMMFSHTWCESGRSFAWL